MLKKRKEAEKKQRQDSRRIEEQRIETNIVKTEALAPAERILALEKILADINNVINKENGQIYNKGARAENRVGWSGFGSMAALTVGGFATAVVAPPIGAAMLIAGVTTGFGVVPAAFGRASAVRKKFQTEANSHLQKLDALKQSVNDLEKSIVENHKEEIVHSKSYEQVSKLSKFSADFEGVAAQQLAKYKELAEAAQKTAEPAKPKDTLLIKKPSQPN